MTIKSVAKEYANFFESISEQTPLSKYKNIFDEKVYFEDPFQKVTGVTKVYEVFQHMYATLHAPRFIVDEIICEDDKAYLRWSFSYQRSSEHDIEKFTGVSRVVFLQTGKVLSHIDYWDAGANVYEKIPLLGSLIRFIKKRIAA
jgi:hypothetical protein